MVTSTIAGEARTISEALRALASMIDRYLQNYNPAGYGTQIGKTITISQQYEENGCDLRITARVEVTRQASCD